MHAYTGPKTPQTLRSGPGSHGTPTFLRSALNADPRPLAPHTRGADSSGIIPCPNGTVPYRVPMQAWPACSSAFKRPQPPPPPAMALVALLAALAPRFVEERYDTVSQ
eukprot:Polyplicarium_translucidae@DN2478_c0_g1_i2.p2